MAESNQIANQSSASKIEILPRAAYSKREAGLVTGTSESTIHRAIKKRRLKASFLGRRVVIRGEELLKWLSATQG